MGSPHNPTDAQLQTLKSAGELTLLQAPFLIDASGGSGASTWSSWWSGWPQRGNRGGRDGGMANVTLPVFDLPIRGISLLEIEPA